MVACVVVVVAQRRELCMSDGLEPATVMREISDLGLRIGELRQAASMPAPDLRATLEAALMELDLALSALRTLGGLQTVAGDDEEGSAAESERRVLRTVFQDAPVPLFLLDRDAVVRRVNQQAAVLLGTSPGYVSGKPFPIFCDLPTRAALRSQLAAVVRTGTRSHAKVRFLRKKAPVDAVITLARVWIRGEADPLVIAAAAVVSGQPPLQEPLEAEITAGDDAMATVMHRMDVLASATELLLAEPLFNESVAVRRCARLLATELADWAIIDVAQGGDLRRQVVFGPDDERCAEVCRILEDLDPAPGALPHTVHGNQQTALHAHVQDLDILGVTDDGISVCGLMGVTSMLSVPIEDGENCLGALTLATSGEHGQFDLMDLGVVQRLARQLGLVIRAARLYQRRSEVADGLQASLLPRELPKIPGLEVSARYIVATRGVEVGGDFYDVFETMNGWGFVLGDVCGKGEEAAAVTATARHGVRLLSRWKTEPAEILTMVNQALMSEDRFVTAVLAELVEKGAGLSIALGSAGHPPSIVIRADGVIRTTGGGGVPLGLFDDFKPAVETLDLEPGDTLFMYSDGVLDACDLMRQRFGHERLIEVLATYNGRPLHEVLVAVERALVDFCEGDLSDDVSILALRVQPLSLN
ncbi:MAG: phosphoserine phosphatase RsbU/P [Streptosporangiaceae bacterium]|jgi:serine phosphatase RsbU (regulator of sigma subunit)/PAS domain-containing protein|nr:putative sensor protein [Streptosporangiaceae bacterium]MDX6432543.1 phosphoserine phosphatase RsbU/P [Streptosporangiaceae bacterium]